MQNQSLNPSRVNKLKTRFDVLLASKGYFPSREKAKTAIMAGEVMVDGRVFDKPGMTVDEDADIQIKNDTCPYVSRGGLKLEKAINEFNIDLTDLVCMDIGASTGGFTDCMLQKGASKVYAIDVGYGQLDYKLRNDNRVVNMEKCNFRYLDPSLIADPIDFASIDVSFISLKLIFPVLSGLLAPTGKVCCLIKPQFEAGREQVGKKGIVKDKAVQREVIRNVLTYGEEVGLFGIDLSFSPITGAKGNIEYLLYLNKDENLRYNISADKITQIVDLSHENLL